MSATQYEECLQDPAALTNVTSHSPSTFTTLYYLWMRLSLCNSSATCLHWECKQNPQLLTTYAGSLLISTSGSRPSTAEVKTCGFLVHLAAWVK